MHETFFYKVLISEMIELKFNANACDFSWCFQQALLKKTNPWHVGSIFSFYFLKNSLYVSGTKRYTSRLQFQDTEIVKGSNIQVYRMSDDLLKRIVSLYLEKKNS